MSDYPILVERFEEGQALVIVCEKCDAERTISGDEILNDGYYSCPAGCDGLSATYKYDEGDKCPSCGKLGRYEKVLDYCCSRVCQLQKEYAEQLAARK